jgi:hypothetical protein
MMNPVHEKKKDRISNVQQSIFNDEMDTLPCHFEESATRNLDVSGKNVISPRTCPEF